MFFGPIITVTSLCLFETATSLKYEVFAFSVQNIKHVMNIT